MTKAINNYDKTKISMAHVFLQYDQATMIHKYSLDYNSDWLVFSGQIMILKQFMKPIIMKQ